MIAIRRLCCLLIVALALSGCGDDSSGGRPTATSTSVPTATATALPTTSATPASTATHSPTLVPASTATATHSAVPTATASATSTASDVPSATPTPQPVDPGAAAWEPVPAEEVAERCGLDPELLAAADPLVNRPYVVVRYGQLCHEYYPSDGATVAQTLDPTEEVFSTTKTLGALVTGIASYQTRALPRTGRKTGQLGDEDRVDHWLDSFTFNPEARVAHVLAMIAHNADLSFGHKQHLYDLVGAVQINRLSDIVNTALSQDPDRLGANIDEFTKRYLFMPLGMHDSTWFDGQADKLYALGWHSTVRDMARVGLLMLHDGVWSGERVLDSAWVYKMTHPSFEDSNTGYGYLTWLNSASHWTFGLGDGLHQTPVDPCAPLSLNVEYPHGLSEAVDCNYDPPYTCDEQPFDVGMWYAAGLGGQYIVGHRALDLVLVVKNSPGGPAELWNAVRPALVALDPRFSGDEDAFCEEYSRGAYAPDLP